MSLHGISRDAWKRYAGEGSWYYEIVAPGYKYNMTDVAAAIGVVQLSRIDEMWKRRCQIARRYTEAFSAVEELDLPSVSREVEDRKSTRLNSSHGYISYAVFCL